MKCQFGPPEASHRGGLYERQIRTIRKAINGLQPSNIKNPTEDEFLTSSKMAEYFTCRLLTKYPFDDTLPTLRPIDLMVGSLNPQDDCPVLLPNNYYADRCSQTSIPLYAENRKCLLVHCKWLKLYVANQQER